MIFSEVRQAGGQQFSVWSINFGYSGRVDAPALIYLTKKKHWGEEFNILPFKGLQPNQPNSVIVSVAISIYCFKGGDCHIDIILGTSTSLSLI